VKRAIDMPITFYLFDEVSSTLASKVRSKQAWSRLVKSYGMLEVGSFYALETVQRALCS